MRANLGDLRRRRTLRGIVVLASGLLLWSMLGVSAQAATTSKTYIGTAMSSMYAGGDYDGVAHNRNTYPFVTFTIMNTTSPQAIGSVDILVPAGIHVTAALGSSLTLAWAGAVSATATATYQNDTATFPITGRVTKKPMVALRNLNLQPGASVTVSIPARMQCSDASARTWEAEVKQSNDFSGLPGNDFLMGSASSMTTAIVGTCSVAWSTEPADAQVSTTITGDPFDPTGAISGPTAVTIYDGGGTVPVDWWQTAITLDFGFAANPAATLTGTSATPDSSGRAVFAPKIDKSGFGYTLTASTALETGTATATSTAFDIYDSVGDCAKNNCNANTNTQATTASLSATGASGFALLSINPGNLDLDKVICGTNVGPANGASDTVVSDANGAQQVTITLNKSVVNKSASKYDLCVRKLWTGTVWTVKNNTLPWFVYSDGIFVQAATPPATPPTTAPLLYQDGLLPNCPAQTTQANVTSPCISYGPALVNKNVQVIALFPAGDPPSRLQ